jgi:hypothetical protein
VEHAHRTTNTKGSRSVSLNIALAFGSSSEQAEIITNPDGNTAFRLAIP